MRYDQYFKVSVIGGAFEIKRYLQRRGGTPLHDIVRYLRMGPAHSANYDYDAAVVIGETAGWDVFEPNPDNVAELQNAIFLLAIRLRPVWAKASIYGILRALKVLDEDQQQCLRDAHLIDVPLTDDVVTWWDKLAEHFRAADENTALEVGRQGERLSLEYERQRLQKLGLSDMEPEWTAVLDNLAGYDIKSYQKDSDGNATALMIEVKAHTAEAMRFILSRREWNTACRYHNSYIFHIWNLSRTSLQIFLPDEVAPHIPSDHGYGLWLDVEIVGAPPHPSDAG